MRISEYQTKSAEFRALLNREAEKPQDQQEWPAVADWLSVDGYATCTTPDCAVYGQTFKVTLYENADGVHRVICGRCGASINPYLNLEEG